MACSWPGVRVITSKRISNPRRANVQADHDAHQVAASLGAPPQDEALALAAERQQSLVAGLELTITDLVDRARGLVDTDRRVILGITGPPGVGKSTVADALHQQLGDAAVVVGMDGFHLAQAELNRLGREGRKGAPDTFDSFGYAELLRRLHDNVDAVVYAPAFRRDLEEPIGSCVPVSRDVPLVITEGNYLLLEGDGWTRARHHIDEVWYVDRPDEIRLNRLILRHQQFGKDPAAARTWAMEIDQANARLVQARRDTADLTFTLIDA
jgi:pantothenate kinase